MDQTNMAMKNQSNMLFSIPLQRDREEKEFGKIMHIKARYPCPGAIRHFPNGLHNV